ncbi:GIY-YIG nuclease family protein [Cytobacillus sp. Hm23]
MDKKQLKRDYKQTHTLMGVYTITNLVNSKMYVGSSMDLAKIINRHQFELKFKTHFNKDLQKEWDLYGKDNFSFQILEKIKPEEEIVLDYNDLNKYANRIKDLEEKWHKTLQADDKHVVKI